MNFDEPIFRIDVLRAAYGDCLLISYGCSSAPSRVLIDGGPPDAYSNLAKHLGHLGCQELELVIVTHIDSDHIGGIVKLLMTVGSSLKIGELWFNGWDQLSRPLRGFSAKDCPSVDRSQAEDRSAAEGHYLAHVAESATLVCNASFGRQALCIGEEWDPPEVELRGGLKLTLLSPGTAQLKALRTAWEKAFDAAPSDAHVRDKLARDRRYRATEATCFGFETLAELAERAGAFDDAVANGSSIAVLAEFEGKSCALLADSHMSVVERSIAKIAARRGERRLRLDVVKLSHHGSKGNISDLFLGMIDCNRFIVSTNGSRFGHPDDEAISKVLLLGGKPLQLLFNYENANTVRWADAKLQSECDFRAIYPPADATALVVDLL